MLRIATALLLMLVLTGCGTFTTLTRDDNAIARSLIKNNTYCDDIPRVYSGVSYNFCILNSRQSGIVFEPVAVFYIVDALFCSVTDTIVLPYTIFQQGQKGSIPISTVF